MKTNMDLMNVSVLTNEEMDLVSAGTFTPNTYSEATYHQIGISTCYHLFEKDEFYFNNRRITMAQADEIVKLGKQVYGALNDGAKGANKIGYGEEAFIRAFNSQLRIKFDEQWDGEPGYSVRYTDYPL